MKPRFYGLALFLSTRGATMAAGALQVWQDSYPFWLGNLAYVGYPILALVASIPAVVLTGVYMMARTAPEKELRQLTPFGNPEKSFAWKAQDSVWTALTLASAVYLSWELLALMAIYVWGAKQVSAKVGKKFNDKIKSAREDDDYDPSEGSEGLTEISIQD